MRGIKEAKDLKGKKVLVRVDWSVPMQDGEVLHDFQIRASLPTIEYLVSQGAEVTLATHLESPEDSVEPLKKYLPEGVTLLDNLRKDPRETANDEDFARELAEGFDVFVNDAFAVSHRQHTSIVSIPKYLPSYAGLRLEEEIRQLSKAFNPPHSFLLILAGAKPETKVPVIEKFLGISDQIFLGGITAQYAFEKYSNNSKVSFPHGDITALDIDEETIRQLAEKIENSNFIVWNGPFGKYEEGYTRGTVELTKILAESGKQVIVGGGDTLVVIDNLNLYDKFTFISTGGGAMLDFLANGTLPGIEALE